ncbi:O-Methyltransferase [Lysobacter dokdonensis DS-58]|uniref:S-adenosyl-L-methionine-dependent methyltransferase n=1 Tax=Lysobacter dokdonensis DS-58 TaxID=1300345 RepID=A0A0A2WJI7_9GAMM|nr:SAM-dependent methyltransferase [Lysobacter dokdonensis]KGQ20341.1 O-Methyltransferase [Lysobacter dokdonensis DS-58]
MVDTNPIRNVSDTALWVATYRAMESERSDALFNDPYARRLGGARGQAIVEALPDGSQTSWPLVVRTCVMDDIVLRLVRSGAKTVLNLAAGLDARPYRLDLPADLRWLHVDMPEMVDYFRTGMAGETPKCRLEFIPADLRDAATRRSVFAKAAEEGPVLAITEGLLIYLEASDVAALAQDLHDIARARWWLMDLASPRLLKILEKRWSPTLKSGNAPFRFGPADGTAFFARAGWRESEWHSTWTDAMRLNRKPRGAAFWNFLLNISPRAHREANLRMSGIALLEGNG